MPIHKTLRQRPFQSAQDWMTKTAATTSAAAGDVFYSSAASSSSSTVTMEEPGPQISLFNDLSPLYLLAEQALIEREPLPVDDLPVDGLVPVDDSSRDDLGIPQTRTQLQEQEEQHDHHRRDNTPAQAAETGEGARIPKDAIIVSRRAPSKKRPPQVVSWRNGFPQHPSYGHSIPHEVQKDVLRQQQEPETTPSRRNGLPEVVSDGSSAPQKSLSPQAEREEQGDRVSCGSRVPEEENMEGLPSEGTEECVLDKEEQPQQEEDSSCDDLNLNKPRENSEDLPNCSSELPEAETNEKAVQNIERPQQAVEEEDSSCDELNMNKPRPSELPEAEANNDETDENKNSRDALTVRKKPLEIHLKLSPGTTSEEASLDYKDAKEDISTKKSSDDDSWQDAISDFVVEEHVVPLVRRGQRQRQRSPRGSTARRRRSSLVSEDSVVGANGFKKGSRIKKVRKIIHFIADLDPQ
jgi:hypothetical protein